MKNIGKNVTIIILVITFFLSCSDQYTTFSPLEYNGKFPDESARSIEFTLSDSGIRNIVLKAPLLNTYKEEESYMDCPEGVEIYSYDAFGAIQSVLTAKYAISKEHSELMEARDSVVIRNLHKGETIKTEQIIWDQKNKRIYSEVEVIQIKSDGTVNKGDGFESDEHFTKYAIKNPHTEMLTDNI